MQNDNPLLPPNIWKFIFNKNKNTENLYTNYYEKKKY